MENCNVVRNSELGKHLESHSLKIPSEDTTNKQYFKDGEPFVLTFCIADDEMFQLKDYLIHPFPGTRRGKLPIDRAEVEVRV